jgi:hypothetical protein
MTKCRLTGAHLVFGLITFVSTATAAPPPAGVNKHCVIKLDPAGSGASPSAAAQELECYPTFPDAIFAATQGWVHLPRGEAFRTQLDILDHELAARETELKEASSVVVAVDYEHIDYNDKYQGASLTWTFSAPCDPYTYHQSPTMPSIYVLQNPHWDNRVSSTRGYAKCQRNTLFEHPDYGGTYLTCTPDCTSVGAMNEKTSSRRWRYPDCSGISSGWRGCRGTGCHACAELLADYPCYFQNHPYCISNSTCGDDHYLCSANCPAPTQADTCQPVICDATASCASAGGGSVSCTGPSGSCYALDNCYVSCNGEQTYCPSPPANCPL